jgi:hypothetical protein
VAAASAQCSAAVRTAAQLLQAASHSGAARVPSGDWCVFVQHTGATVTQQHKCACLMLLANSVYTHE